jgi:hypothetical protein
MITKSILLKHDAQVTKQIITSLEIILQQNYFSFENNLYQPEKGVSVGSPISNTIAEIFLQHIENTYLKQLLDTKSIIFCTRYVDDILPIYDTQSMYSNTIHKYINQIHPNLQLKPTHENDNCINFLDLLIIRNPANLENDIYWKPTTTDTAINYLSNIPLNKKLQLTDTISTECKHYH